MMYGITNLKYISILRLLQPYFYS